MSDNRHLENTSRRIPKSLCSWSSNSTRVFSIAVYLNRIIQEGSEIIHSSFNTCCCWPQAHLQKWQKKEVFFHLGLAMIRHSVIHARLACLIIAKLVEKDLLFIIFASESEASNIKLKGDKNKIYLTAAAAVLFLPGNQFFLTCSTEKWFIFLNWCKCVSLLIFIFRNGFKL